MPSSGTNSSSSIERSNDRYTRKRIDSCWYFWQRPFGLGGKPSSCSAGDASQVASPGVSHLLEAQVKAKVDTSEGGGRDQTERCFASYVSYPHLVPRWF